MSPNVVYVPFSMWLQGSFGTLYKGTYCGQDVAVKILRDIQDDPQQYEEFAQVRAGPLPCSSHSSVASPPASCSLHHFCGLSVCAMLQLPT